MDLPHGFPRFEALEWPLYERQIELLDRATQAVRFAERGAAQLVETLERTDATGLSAQAIADRRQAVYDARRKITDAQARRAAGQQAAMAGIVAGAPEAERLAGEDYRDASALRRGKLERDMRRLREFVDQVVDLVALAEAA